MSKQKSIFFLGIWVAILPFLGFPGSWKRTLALLSGAGIAYIGYIMNKEKTAEVRHHPHATYVENKAPDTHAEISHAESDHSNNNQ